MAQSDKTKLRFVLIFPPLLTILLGLDSQYVAESFGNGRIFATILLPIWATWLFYHSDTALRRVILVMLPLSYLGELISSPWLELYFYRGNKIPFYIPFGHSVVFASCMMLANLPKIEARSELIVKVLKPILIVSILTAGLVFDDHFTLFFGLLLILILQLKGWSHFYLLMAVIVMTIEVIGTSFKCWTWQPESPYLFQTVNPPIGAVYIYVIGDIVVQWVANLFTPKNTEEKIKNSF
ncbi:MAG: hypothetical protein NE330_00620 [Lentisphaeraceae bacterium]|nr:hypothetical protein [Lentisphaeraceae bacterium]